MTRSIRRGISLAAVIGLVAAVTAWAGPPVGTPIDNAAQAAGADSASSVPLGVASNTVRAIVGRSEALALVGCSRLPQVAYPGSGSDATRRLVEDRVWLDAGTDAAPGSLRAFLSDGTLVMTSCAEVYRLAPWRWIEGSTLVWEEDGRSIRAEVVLA